MDNDPAELQARAAPEATADQLAGYLPCIDLGISLALASMNH
jgi:hypothetical protein